MNQLWKPTARDTLSLNRGTAKLKIATLRADGRLEKFECACGYFMYKLDGKKTITMRGAAHDCVASRKLG